MKLRHPVLLMPLLWAAGVSTALAHPVHISTGEGHFNAETKRMEVCLTVFADDLETLLSARAHRPVSLTKTPAADVDPLILACLKESFLVRNRHGDRQTLTWTGRKFEPARAAAPAPSPAAAAPPEACVLLFFEVALPEGTGGLTLQYHLLGDIFRDQKNLVQLHDGPRRAALAFSPVSPPRPVVFKAPAPP